MKDINERLRSIETVSMTFILYNLVAFLLCVLVALIIFFKPHKIKVAGIPTGFVEKQVQLNGITLNYVEGPANGKPLLLIPGQMESWQGYKRVMSVLSQQFRVFIPDLRGHGKSSRTPGEYSYNICGSDLKIFINEVIKEPVYVSGLSSGAVLSIWLGAYAPEMVLAVIAEDPPIFSSIWPRIAQEKFMKRLFEIPIECFSDPHNRDFLKYYSSLGAPKQGQDELMLIPPGFAKFIVGIYESNKKKHPEKEYDPPFLPFDARCGFLFLSEYDVDFSRATIDGRLSRDFNPEDALSKVNCPMLLIHAQHSRHETWGVVGAMDDEDAKKVKELVKNLSYVQVNSGHTVHMTKPKIFLDIVTKYLSALNG